VEHYGCSDYAEEVCLEKAKVSRDFLLKLPKNPARNALAEMLDFLVERAF